MLSQNNYYASQQMQYSGLQTGYQQTLYPNQQQGLQQIACLNQQPGYQQILYPNQQVGYQQISSTNQQAPYLNQQAKPLQIIYPNTLSTVKLNSNNSKKPKSKQKQPKLSTNLYIKNLPSSITTNEDLGNMFSQFGTVKSPLLLKFGTGLCNMADHKSAVAAINALNGKFVEGKFLVVKWYVSSKEKNKRKERKQKVENC
ncbi:putative polyadenylate binding protein [Histomonas meleagridis]|uniref:putative polyadenylate binding protein n=1 Tax=Histomonas meleagridis TaxID=135588 RepID=UPI003559B3FD|nr:putative polyadenylate binding protein [Histomonas meleagridis]